MIRQILAAELNLSEKHCDCDNIGGDWGLVDRAEKWYIEFCSDGYQAANTATWQEKGEELYRKLDAYNNGRLCAPKGN
jgi:hypothetical protein